MAKDDKPTAVDKGKGKAVDPPAKDKAPKDKKPGGGDKKGKKDEPAEGIYRSPRSLKVLSAKLADRQCRVI